MGNKEYIERVALLKTPPFTKYGGDLSQYTEGYLDCAEEARKAVNDAPAADVVEVRHGEWIPVEGDVIWKCSICDAEISTSWDYENEDMFKYCPCCGAKMDGGKEQT